MIFEYFGVNILENQSRALALVHKMPGVAVLFCSSRKFKVDVFKKQYPQCSGAFKPTVV